MRRGILLLLASLLLLSLAACGDGNGNNGDAGNDLNPSGSGGRDAELADALEWKAKAEFVYSIDGLDFQIAAYKAAMAWLRNDREALARLLADPEYETGLTDDRGDWSDDYEYMVFKYPHPVYGVITDGVYPASYQLLRKGDDSADYIDMGLIKTDNGWMVSRLSFQK